MNVRLLTGLLLGVALVVAACGSNKNNNAGGSPASSGSQSVVGATGGPVTGNLNVWAMGNEGDKLSTLVTTFEKQYPGVHVNVTTIGWGEAHDKLVTAIAGHQTPDVSQIGTTWMGEFVKAGAFDPVPSSFNQSDFYKAAWDAASVNGQAYGVPWYIDTRMVYYRKDLAAKAGITSPPTTWQDLYNLASALKNKAGTKWGISMTVGTGSDAEWYPMLWSWGGQVINSSGQFALNSSQAVQSLKYYQSFFTNGLAPKQVPQGFDVTPAFVQGTHPMFFSGSWMISLLEQAGGGKSFDSKIGLAPMPSVSGSGSGTSFMGGADLSVFKDAHNKPAAWAFVKFLSQPSIQAQWFQTVTDLPSLKAAWNQGTLASDPMLKAFGQQASHAKAPPSAPSFAQVSSDICNVLEQLSSGTITPAQAAASMQQQAQSVGTH